MSSRWYVPLLSSSFSRTRIRCPQISAKLSDYRTQFRIQGDNNARELLNVYFGGDTSAIQDKQKCIEFGLYYCKEDEYKFQFKGSDRRVVCQMPYCLYYSVQNPFLGRLQGFGEIFEQNLPRNILNPLSIHATQESTSQLGHTCSSWRSRLGSCSGKL